MQHKLKRMTFLSYQPITKRETGNPEEMPEYNFGEQRPDAILERDKVLTEKFGYNPYWATGGDTVKEVMIGSLFSAPQNPFIAHVFQTEEYIRVDKVKQELSSHHHLEGHTLDFINDSADNISSEFLVKSLEGTGPRFLYYLPNLFDCNRSSFHVLDGFIYDSGYFKKLSQPFPGIWDNAVKNCSNFTHDYLEIDKEAYARDAHINPAAIDTIINAKYAKLVFEATILPVILESLSLENIVGDNELNFRTAWFYQVCWTFKPLCRLYNDFSTACHTGTLDHDLYTKFATRGYDLIIEDVNVLMALSGNKKIYPNDFCPCGSGKKFKKCHGGGRFERCWL